MIIALMFLFGRGISGDPHAVPLMLTVNMHVLAIIYKRFSYSVPSMHAHFTLCTLAQGAMLKGQ
jgi:hypothetical protein